MRDIEKVQALIHRIETDAFPGFGDLSEQCLESLDALKAMLARAQDAGPVAEVGDNHVLQWCPPYSRPPIGTKLFAGHPPAANQGVPDAYAVIEDEGKIGYTVMVRTDGIPEDQAEETARRFCHDHINDCAGHGLEGAGQWVVRPITIGGPKLPTPPQPMEDES